MTKQAAKKVSRNRYSEEFKAEALALADKVGVANAATQLGLHNSQIYGWRARARVKADRSQLEQDQAAEIVRLKRKLAQQAEELAIVKKAATYFA